MNDELICFSSPRWPCDAHQAIPRSDLFCPHARLLVASGISADAARARGYQSVDSATRLKTLGFADYQRLPTGLLLPVRGVQGGDEPIGFQYRPDQPRSDHQRNRTVKYETPAGWKMRLDVNPLAQPTLADAGTRLYVTEGIRKGDAAASRGWCCIALLGVRCWSGNARADWDAVALDGREVVIVYDSDAETNPEVDAARIQLAEFLAGRGAGVRIAHLSTGEDGGKLGLDDFLARGGTEDMLLAGTTAWRGQADQPQTRRFPGRTHYDLIHEQVEPVQPLVEGFVDDAGTLINLTGLPETGKSHIALEMATRIAQGHGLLLDYYPIRAQGAVGVWLQDDSTRRLISRIQAVAAANNVADDLPITYHIQEDLRLPDDLPELRAEVERLGQKLVVLDSFYCFVPGIDLKDAAAAEIYKAIRTEICEQTGCNVLVVDHSPWPTETNRMHYARAYGTVFKSAARRVGMHLEASGDKIRVTIRGNDLAQSKPILVRFDPVTLRFTKATPDSTAIEDVETSVQEFVEANPGCSTTAIEAGVGGRHQTVRAALDTLAERGEIRKQTAKEVGKTGRGVYWSPAE